LALLDEGCSNINNSIRETGILLKLATREVAHSSTTPSRSASLRSPPVRLENIIHTLFYVVSYSIHIPGNTGGNQTCVSLKPENQWDLSSGLASNLKTRRRIIQMSRGLAYSSNHRQKKLLACNSAVEEKHDHLELKTQGLAILRRKNQIVTKQLMWNSMRRAHLGPKSGDRTWHGDNYG